MTIYLSSKTIKMNVRDHTLKQIYNQVIFKLPDINQRWALALDGQLATVKPKKPPMEMHVRQNTNYPLYYSQVT